MEPETKSLAERSLQAIKWNYLGTVVRVLSQFVAQIALARILGPDIIGSFAYALLLSALLGLVIDQGFGWAMVNATSVTEHEFTVVFTRVMLGALACSLGSFWLADHIAALMGDRAAAQTIRYLSPAFMLLGLSVIAQAKLRKALRFKEIQIAQTLSYLVAYPLVGVGLAMAGLGVVSLVAAWILQAVLAFLVMIRYTPQKFSFANPFSRLAFGSYGRDILAINLVNWIVDNAGAVFVGKLFGAAPLGLYSTTMGLVRTPANHLVVNLQTVLFPTAAASKSDLELLGRLYSTALAAVLFIATPVFSFVAVAATAIVPALLGPKWTAAGALLPPIALAMIPHVVSSVTGSTLSGRGDQRVELLSQVLLLALLVSCYLVLPITSVVEVCWLFLVLYVLRAIFLVVVASRKLQVGSLWVLAAFKGPGVVAVAGSVFYLAIKSLHEFSPIELVLGGAGVFGLTGLIAVAVWPRFLVAEHVRQLLARYRAGSGAIATIAQLLTR